MNINTAKLFKLKKQVMKESSELHYLKERLNRVQGTGGKAEQKAKEAVDEQSYKLSEIVVQYDNEKKKLADEIVTVEGKAKERKISVELIMLQCWQIQDKLNIPKKYLEGVSFHCNHYAQNFPRAYKYDPVSTQFDAEFKNGSWRITNIERKHCGNQQYSIKLTQEAKDAIIRSFEH